MQNQGFRVKQIAMSRSQKKIFAIRELTKIYGSGETEVRALDGVDVDIFEGEMLVLLGPSGSGKSTFLNIVGGIDQASSGHVKFRQLNLADLGQRQLTRYRRENVGFVFQFYNLIPSLSALENVALVTEVAKNPMKPMDALEMVSLTDRAHHFPAELSGGEQQRVAIARAIAKRPDVLLCDEPTGALDSATGIIVLSAISRINEELGTTTAIITHNASIRRIANRVVYFHDGRIAEIVENADRLRPEDVSW